MIHRFYTLLAAAAVCVVSSHPLYADPDTIPPTISCPDDITVEGGASGAIVVFEVTAFDDGGLASFTVEPASGSLFPFGETFVTSIATDTTGNWASCIFTVTVVNDVTPPVIAIPDDIVINAWVEPVPAVTGMATASDNSGLPPEITYLDDTAEFDGYVSILRIWTATDESGNSAWGAQLIIIVTNPGELITAVQDDVDALDLPPNVAAPLHALLNSALASFDAGRLNACRNKLAALIHHVDAQRGHQLTDADADLLIAEILTILAELGD